MRFNKQQHNNTNTLSQVKERIAVLEMLLYKHHTEGIPNDIFERLIKNGFMEKSNDGGYVWTDLSNELSKKFNKEFGYNEFGYKSN